MLALALGEKDALPHVVAVLEEERLAEPQTVSDAVAQGEALGEGVGDCELQALGDCVRETVPLPHADRVAVSEGVSDDVAHCDTEALDESDGDAVSQVDRVSVGEAEADPQSDGDAVPQPLRDAVPELLEVVHGLPLPLVV